jgi:hypothetical protein
MVRMLPILVRVKQTSKMKKTVKTVRVVVENESHLVIRRQRSVTRTSGEIKAANEESGIDLEKEGEQDGGENVEE